MSDGKKMAYNIEEVTVNYTEDDILIVRELDKEVLNNKGAWATIMYRYQDWDPVKKAYGPDKYTIRRYRKQNNEFRPQSKFNISNREQARQVIDVLNKWIALAEE
jgi:hypothetical protein